MKLEEQVCTLEQSRKLQELGVKAGHLFKWQHTPIQTRNGEDFTCNIVPEAYSPCSDATTLYPAYTVAELGEMLPDMLQDTANGCYFSRSYKCPEIGWWYYYINSDLASLHEVKGLPSEAQARAAMLIHLIEAGIVTPELLTPSAQ